LDPRDPRGSFDRLYRERAPVYEKNADLRVTNNSRRAEDTAAEILKNIPIQHGRE
jgi:shikimate kinase